MLSTSYSVLDQLRMPHGLYMASPHKDYQYVWIRDCFYMSLPYLDKNNRIYEKAYHRMLDLFRCYEWKLDIHTQRKPKYEWEYLHARYSSQEVKEIHDQSWGHAQHDMVGAFLFGLGEGIRRNKKMIRDERDKRIIQKIINYLQTVEYWSDPDNGMWEEWREIHSSSVGACVAGLNSIKAHIPVPHELLANGVSQLFRLLPRESLDKRADLAQLSLIYPYRLLDGPLAEYVLQQIEKWLVRERGVIRYEGDSYYSTLEEEFGRDQPREFYYGSEAEWTFGFPWLSLCYMQMGHEEKARLYLQKTESIMSEPGILPELYKSGSSTPNPNTPLGWSCAMYILAKEAFAKRN